MLFWLTLIFLLSVMSLIITRDFPTDLDIWFFVISLFIISAMVISTPIIYFDEMSNIQEFKATKETVYQLRDKSNINFEKATIGKDIIEANNWLARQKYWKSSFWFGVSIPKEVLKLEKIEY